MTTALLLGRPRAIAFPRLATPAQWIFAGAMGVLWLHFLDATIVHPQANANWFEHLLQAALGVTVPPFAIAAYIRGGRWLRGLSAVGFGLVAMTVGAVIHIVGAIKNSSMNPDDYSGIAMAVAGLILVFLGTVTLVRTIPKIRYRLALIPAAPLLGFWVLLPLIMGTYIAHAPRYEIGEFDMGAPHEAVSFETSDGLTIHGSYVAPTNGAVVIVAHGSGGARIRPVLHERMLVANGYGVLAIDSRGHGESEGTTNALGWGAYPDLIGASDYLKTRPEVEPGRIGVLGISMGAETALDAATYGLDVSAIVADGAGGRSINEVLSLKRRWTDVFGLPALAGVNGVASVLTGSTPPSSLESRVDRITTPTFFISSANVAEERDLNRIWFEEAETEKLAWEVDASHTGGLKTHPTEYEQRVIGFFDAHLLTK